MKEKNKCNIIQNLLPSYTDNLTEKETNQYIEEHLKDCTKCQKVLEEMKEKLEVNIKEKAQNEINYMKKFNKRMRVLKGILL